MSSMVPTMLNAMMKPQKVIELKDPDEDPFADIETFKDRARQASDFLKALAHENRLSILGLIAARERSVTELEQLLSLRQPAVSQQLARLRMDGLVQTRREGKAIYYSLASERVRRLIAVMHEMFWQEDGETATGADSLRSSLQLKCVPRDKGKPRRNSAPSIGFLPARWTRVKRTA